MPCMRHLGTLPVRRQAHWMIGILWASLFLFSCTQPAASPIVSAPPATPVRTVSDTYFGTQVVDNYRWLENPSDPEVHAWAEAQTQRVRAYIDALPYRRALGERLMQLVSQTSPSYSDLKSAGAHVFAIFN